VELKLQNRASAIRREGETGLEKGAEESLVNNADAFKRDAVSPDHPPDKHICGVDEAAADQPYHRCR